MALILVIDTSTPAVTAGVATLDEGGCAVRAERVTVDAKAHAELLLPNVIAALADVDAALGDVDAVVCGQGPGPFTGLRVGMVTAAALGDALGVPVYGVCGLDAIAAEVTDRRSPTDAARPFLVVTDARRREVYWAAYDAAGRRTAGPCVQSPGSLRTGIDTRPDAGSDVAFAAGTGARLYADALGLPVTGPEFPSVGGLIAVAAPEIRAGRAPESLRPLYLRRPDAALPVPRKLVSQRGR